MTTPELGDPFLDTPVDILEAMPSFAAEYSVPHIAIPATNIICRDGQATTRYSLETVKAMTTRRELLLVTDFWLDNPQEMPWCLGPKTMTFIRAFCGYQPAVANLDRLQRNREEEITELVKAPLDFVLLETVVIDDTPHSMVTGKALRRFIKREMPNEKHVRVGKIVEHIGQMLTPNYNEHEEAENMEYLQDLEDRAPHITAPGVAYLGSQRWDAASNWGVSPDIFPLGYDLLGNPGKSGLWGHTPRSDKVIRSYIQALHSTQS